MWINLVVFTLLSICFIVLMKVNTNLKEELRKINVELGGIDIVKQWYGELYDSLELTRIAISDINEDFPIAYRLLKDIDYYNRMIDKHSRLYKESGFAQYDGNGRANEDKILMNHFKQELKEAHNDLDKIRERNKVHD